MPNCQKVSEKSENVFLIEVVLKITDKFLINFTGREHFGQFENCESKKFSPFRKIRFWFEFKKIPKKLVQAKPKA